MTEHDTRVRIDQLRQDTSLASEDRVLGALLLIAELLMEIRLKQGEPHRP